MPGPVRLSGWPGFAGLMFGDRAAGASGGGSLVRAARSRSRHNSALHAVLEPGAGTLTRWVAHCRHEHAGQSFTPDWMPVNVADTPVNRAFFGSTGTAGGFSPFPQLCGSSR
jgi:hypothetical protein